MTTNQRKSLAVQFIRGEGVEIGALHAPLRLPYGATAKYVDIASREDSIKKYPEVDGSRIVEVDYIEDGFVLAGVPRASQNFLIANHVLEHSPNPIQAVLNWSATLKQDGVMFVTVPIAEQCFDKGRALTPLQHLVEDFELYKAGDVAQMEQRNKEHLAEWIQIAEPNIAAMEMAGYEPPPTQDLATRIAEADMANLDIHFHTFSMVSYLEMLHFITNEVDPTLDVEAVVRNRAEIVSVLRKVSVG